MNFFFTCFYFFTLFRILFPEIQPRLTSLLKKGYKVLLYLTFMLNLICSINIFLVVFVFVAQVSSSYLFLFRWCFSPIRWVFLEANSDRRCSSQKLRIFYRHCSCPSRWMTLDYFTYSTVYKSGVCKNFFLCFWRTSFMLTKVGFIIMQMNFSIWLYF